MRVEERGIGLHPTGHADYYCDGDHPLPRRPTWQLSHRHILGRSLHLCDECREKYEQFTCHMTDRPEWHKM